MFTQRQCIKNFMAGLRRILILSVSLSLKDLSNTFRFKAVYIFLLYHFKPLPHTQIMQTT